MKYQVTARSHVALLLFLFGVGSVPFTDTCATVVAQEAKQATKTSELQKQIQQLTQAIKAGDDATALKLLDRLIKSGSTQLRRKLLPMKLDILLASEKSQPKAADFLVQVGKQYADVSLLNEIAWFVVQRSQAGMTINKDAVVAAIGLAEQAASSGDPSHFNTLSNLLAIKGDYRKAIEVQKKAIDLCKDPRAKFRLEDTLRKLLFNETATPETRKALAKAVDIRVEAIACYRKQQHKEALKLLQSAREILANSVGTKHPDYATTANNLAVMYQTQGDYAGAMLALQEAKDAREHVLGKQHPDYVNSLNNLAELHKAKGNHDAALSLFQEALEIREQMFGTQCGEYADSLYNIALQHQAMGNLQRALPLLKQAVETKAQVLGQRHPSYALSLNKLAHLHAEMHDYDAALSLHQQVLVVCEQVHGIRHPNYAISLNNLAALHVTMSSHAAAVPLYEQALKIYEDVLGERNPNYALCLHNLAGLYNEMGNHAAALPLHQKALRIREEVLGKQHPDYAASLNGLAMLHRRMGDHTTALSLCKKSNQIYKQVFGNRHPDYAMSLHNLALIHEEMGNHAAALPLYQQALRIREQLLGKQHPDYAGSLNNLAYLHLSMGDHDAGLRMCQEVLEIREKVFGKQHREYAQSLNNLAFQHMTMGDHAAALPLYQQAAQLNEEILGSQHPELAKVLNSLAMLHNATNDHAIALPLFQKALNIVRGTLTSTSVVLSENQQRIYAERNSHYLDHLIGTSLRLNKSQNDVFAEVLNWKGSTMARQVSYRTVANRIETADLFKRLRSVSSKLTAHYQSDSSNPTWHERLEQLTVQRTELEAELASKSLEFAEIQKRLTVRDVLDLLPESTALVDILKYNDWSPDQENIGKWTTQRRYAAFVIRHGAEVAMIDLGSSEQIDGAIEIWRKPFVEEVHTQEQLDAHSKAAVALRKQVWLPVQALLGGMTKVLVSPDGQLGSLPLAALPGEQPGSYLIDRYTIGNLPVPRLLPRLVKKSKDEVIAKGDLLLLGGVDYEHSVDRNADDDAQQSRPKPGLIADQRWRFLEGSLSEVDAIERLYRQLKEVESDGLTKLTRAAATERRLRELAPNYQVLHFATHGYFADPKYQTTREASENDFFKRDRMTSTFSDKAIYSANTYNPGILSWLVLAGANGAMQNADADDGMLTAQEINYLPLRGTKLVTLSACETGLGKVAGGEGLIGLQRAFQIAGAKTVIATSWKVDDKMTQKLMELFYRNYFAKKMGILEALRAAQLAILNDPQVAEGVNSTRGAVRDRRRIENSKSTAKTERADPYYWAPFILSGDWR